MNFSYLGHEIELGGYHDDAVGGFAFPIQIDGTKFALGILDPETVTPSIAEKLARALKYTVWRQDYPDGRFQDSSKYEAANAEWESVRPQVEAHILGVMSDKTNF